jgi:hypothetical protein
MRMTILRLGLTLALGLLLIGGLTAPSPAPIAWSDMANPSADEQYVLEVINRARANPSAEGTRLSTFSPVPLPGGDITEGLATPSNVGVRPPLAMSAMLLATAQAHSDDMYTRDYFAHDTLAPPTQTWDQRITAGGYIWSFVGENIATASSGTAAFLEDLLMVDWYLSGGVPTPVPGRGHRSNLLDVDSGSSPFREIGVGYHLGAAVLPSGNKDFLTEDFGRRSSVGPFLVGVVWDDTGGLPFYTQGKGISGATITLSPAGTYFATTATAGGYSFPIGTSGTVIVTCSGGPFTHTVYKAVNLTGENVKVDFKLSDLSIVDTDGDGLPDSWEMAHFNNLAQGPADDPDGDTFNNLAEFNAGTDPMDPNSKPSPGGGGGGGGGAGTGNSNGGGGGGGGGGCGLTGLEGLLVLAGLRFRRK